MKSLILIFLIFTFSPKPKFIIISGDITCKSCVIQLHHYFTKKSKKTNVTIGIEDRGSFIMNETKINYFLDELPNAKFETINSKGLFRKNEKYPYVLKIIGTDTTKISYDDLFSSDFLNASVLDN